MRTRPYNILCFSAVERAVANFFKRPSREEENSDENHGNVNLITKILYEGNSRLNNTRRYIYQW